MNTIAVGGSIGIGTSGYATANLMLGGAVALLSIALYAGAEPAKKGRTKQCPLCLEAMNKEAKVCRHCGRDVPAVPNPYA